MARHLASGKEVSESIFEALLTEMAAHYTAPGAVLPSKVALESIGYQVGMQLCERSAGSCARSRSRA
jgi:hypothetical protein